MINQKMKWSVVTFLLVILLNASAFGNDYSIQFNPVKYSFDSLTISSSQLESDPSEDTGLNTEFDRSTQKGSIYLELGGANDPEAIGGTIGFSYETSKILSFHGGLTYFSSEHSSDVFGGVTLGVRTNVRMFPVMPFVGFGAFSGISKEYIPAENDDIDNDGDGETDEPGEEDEVIDDIMASIYPEIGVNFMVAEDAGLMLMAKRYYTTEGDDYKFWMYSMAFSFYF